MSRKTLQRIIHSNLFSLLVLLILVAGLAYVAWDFTRTYRKEPDFGGMVTLRQADLKLDGTSAEVLHLNRDMILNYITDKKILEPIAARYGWNVLYEEMVDSIDVKQRLSSQNSYIVIANTRNAERSLKVAGALSLSFLEEYRKKWVVQSRRQLQACAERIDNLRQELCELKKLKSRFRDENELRPLNTEIEMQALNEQLVEAQNQFLTAYGAYISGLEAKRSELQLEYDLARQVYSSDNAEIRNMQLKLAELERQCEENRRKLSRQKPDLYRLTMNPSRLTGLPNDILYFYDNVQTLQQLKLALMLGSLIEEKEKMLEQEQQKKNTIERLLESNSCDVFIREMAR